MKRILLLIAFCYISVLASAQNPYPVVPISTVQFVNSAKLAATPPNDSSDYVNPSFTDSLYRDTVRFDGYVLFDPRTYGLSTSRKATVLSADTIAKPWGGVEIMCEPAGTGRTLAQLLNETKFYENLRPGTKVRVTGVIRQFRGSAPATSKTGQSQVNMIKASVDWENGVEILDLNPYSIKPAEITIDSLMTGNANTGQVIQKVSGEKWEGSYVELKDVTVFTRTPSGSRWFWSVADSKGNAIDIGDFSGWFRNDNNAADTLPVGRFTPPVIGTKLAFIKGVIIESFVGGQFRYTLAPLKPSDLGQSSYTPPILESKSRIPVIANSTDSVFITAKVLQGSARVSNLKLFYANGLLTTAFDSVTMTRNVLPNDTMVWFGKIPPYANGSVVKYFIKLTDANNFANYAPDTFATNSNYVIMDGGPQSIKDLQFSVSPNNSSIWNGDSLTNINIKAIVTSTSMAQGTVNILTLQTKNTNDSNTAIVVNRQVGDATASWRVGDEINITSTRVVESFGVTALVFPNATKVSSGNTLPPVKKGLNINDIATISATPSRRWELTPFEGMIVGFDSVYVVKKNADGADTDPGFGEFLINTDKNATTGLRVDDIAGSLPDLFNQNLRVGQLMKKAQGVFYLSFSNWKLEPRDSNDLDFSDIADTTRPVITLLGKNPDSLLLNGSYVDPGFTANDNIDGDLTSSVTFTSFVDSSKVNTYGILYSVKDKAGNTGSAVRSVVVYLPVGVNENELLGVLTSLYPNPAKEELTINVTGTKTLPLEVSILDMSGRLVESKTFYTKDIHSNFNLSALESGVYFCNFKNANGFKTMKFVIAK